MSIEAICLGEALIDMVSTRHGVSLEFAPGFKCAAGGAPANVAVGLAKLGIKTGFIGKVGADPFGRRLARILKENGVDTSFMLFDKQVRTTLAFVSLKSDGERDFVFYRNPGADMMLAPEEIAPEYIEQARLFHFGSISLICEPARTATLKAAEVARAAELLVSYDPNLRPSLWDSLARAKAEIVNGFSYVDVAKVSQEELEFIAGYSGDIARATQRLAEEFDNLLLVVVTLGAKGCYYYMRDKGYSGYLAGFKVDTVDTTGAGDGFLAGMLAGILDKRSRGSSLSELKVDEELESILRVANAAGAVTTTKKGVIPALPSRIRIAQLLSATKP